MGSPRSQAEATIRTFLGTTNKGADLTADTSLFADGVGLDSLEIAELSAVLEDDLGSDPFSVGIMAQTVGEILDYYSDDPQPA